MDPSLRRQGSIPGTSPNDGDLPELVASISPTNTSAPRPARSLRARPSDVLLREHASPPEPLRSPSRTHNLPSRSTSKMSLFNLFSKPKVERARGAREPSVDKRSQSVSTTRSAPKKDVMLSRVQDACCEPPRSRPPPRVQSVKSDSSFSVDSNVPPMPPPYSRSQTNLQPSNSGRESRQPSFDLVPLFQVYPQATKYGMLEVTPLTPEMILQMAKARRPSVDTLVRSRSRDDVKTGSDGKTLVKAPAFIRHAASASLSKVETHRKLFVLITSGQLLQYAEEGQHDRLPEKVLHLGQESATFACDLIPGKHHVLQVFQAIDEQGVMVTPSASIFRKIGLRGQSARRMASNFLLVLPGAVEMDSWMTAIRKQIEAQGGRRPESPEKLQRPVAAHSVELSATSLTKTPSHRYQVKRDPEKVTSVSSSATETREVVLLPPILKIDGNEVPSGEDDDFIAPTAPPAAGAAELDTESDLHQRTITVKIDGVSSSELAATTKQGEDDTATLDGIEQEASQILTEGEVARDRAPSDAPSSGSSTTVSLEQQSVEKLRGSMRASHSSTAPTSCASSVTSSPPPLSDTVLAAQDVFSQGSLPPKKPVRVVSSYALNRRSMINTPPPLEQAPLWRANTHEGTIGPRSGLGIDAVMDSPTVGHHHDGLLGVSAPMHLSLAHSSPNLRAKAEPHQKCDSTTMQSPSNADRIQGQPLSVVTNLPSHNLGNKPYPSNGSSVMQTARTVCYSPTSSDQRRMSRIDPPSKPKRYYAQTAVLPEDAVLTALPPQRSASIAVVQPARVVPSHAMTAKVPLPTPDMHALAAKVDFATQTTISTSNIPPRKSPSPSLSRNSPSPDSRAASHEQKDASPLLDASQHLAMFPSPPLPQGQTVHTVRDSTRRSMSPFMSSYLAQQGLMQAGAGGTSLRRPTSMMIKSDRAPFLSSTRQPTSAPSTTAVPFRTGTTPPIRSLKPSRNSIVLQTDLAGRDSSSTPSPTTTSGIIPLTLSTSANRSTMTFPSPPIHIPLHLYINSTSESLSPTSSPATDEASDIATPLPSSASSPPASHSSSPFPQQPMSDRPISQSFPPLPPSRPTSRQTYQHSSRKTSRSTLTLGSHAGLPELDLGIPIIGLGPPAPPPQAPLPDLPPTAALSSRPTSPFVPFRLPQLAAMNDINGAMSHAFPNPSPPNRAPYVAPSRARTSPTRATKSPNHSTSGSDSSTSTTDSDTSCLSILESSISPAPLSPQSSHSNTIIPSSSGLSVLTA